MSSSAGMKMRRQPVWPEGKAPDRIEVKIQGNEGGFTDGYGNAFPVPVNLRAHPMVTAAPLSGVWHWLRPAQSEEISSHAAG